MMLLFLNCSRELSIIWTLSSLALALCLMATMRGHISLISWSTWSWTSQYDLHMASRRSLSSSSSCSCSRNRTDLVMAASAPTPARATISSWTWSATAVFSTVVS